MANPLGGGSSGFMYVSDAGAGDVQVFNWPKPINPVGTLVGFSEPQGICNDGKNVYITSTTAAAIIEFAAGASTPTRTIDDPDGLPVGCSVDPTTGDLAISNILSKSYGQGSLDIYIKAKGKPHEIKSEDLFKLFSVQYDGSGNLFVTGLTAAYAPVYAKLSAGSKHIKVTCPSFSKSFPGSLGWDGTYIVVGGDNGLYRVKGCKRVGFTPVSVSQFYIDGNRIVAPDAGSLSVGIYSYPKGDLISTIGGFSQPIGITVVNSR
jgi:hypothetical protein